MSAFTWAEKILEFNSDLNLDSALLPDGIEPLNPFQGQFSAQIHQIALSFYSRYYGDTEKRNWILGINPGRLGAGATGIPFTDTFHLRSHCGIKPNIPDSREPSSAFVYEMINAFGKQVTGPEASPETCAAAFYSRFYIGSVCPLGFVKKGPNGKLVNYNYYDDAILQNAVLPFIIDSLKKQRDWGLKTEKVYLFGSGKNLRFLERLNQQHQLFGQLVPLDHPRFIAQYRWKSRPLFIEKYLNAFLS